MKTFIIYSLKMIFHLVFLLMLMASAYSQSDQRAELNTSTLESEKPSATPQADIHSPLDKETEVAHKYRVSIPYFVIEGLIEDSWNDRTSTQHLELHIKHNLDNKNIIGVKFASWRLFQPMGITWWDGILDKLESESEFYPGHVREIGIGITYQRMLWKGLFAVAEVLPQFQTYLDLDGKKISDDFKLYTSYHLGYNFSFGRNKRFFIEPQINCMYWMFDNNAPDGFKQLDDQWRNYFLFEPQIYLGVNF